MSSKILSVDTLNRNVVQAEYAVRGELVLKAMDYQKQLKAGASLPFDRTISCNIGNPQELGQKPISFPRQVLALLNYPELMDTPGAAEAFPADAVARARELLENIPGGTGAYSNSQGVPYLREGVARFLEERDGFPASADDLFLTDGASPAVQMLLRAMIRGENDGVLVPLPQYPLYSAGIQLFGGSMVAYELDEAAGWGTTVAGLRASLADARARGVEVRALVVINPGNPTGQCLTEENQRDIIRFCAEERLVLMADEVYQQNIWHDRGPWRSFKHVLRSMGDEFADFELASFHSVSKGFLGECGRRGGFVELVGFDDDVKQQLYKLVSVNLCSNVEGQVMTYLMTNPPREGDESYAGYCAERDAILESLARRAAMLTEAYNSMEGVTCNASEGALYAFPQITLPPRAVEAAEAAGKAPDTFYCLAMLEATGVVVVPGSGFGQADGTWHFRSTILPAESEIADVIERTKAFHAEFMGQYS